MLGVRIKSKNGQIEGLREVNAILKAFGDDSVKQLRKELKGKASPYIKGIRSFIKGAESRLKAPSARMPNGMNIYNNAPKGSSFSVPTVTMLYEPSKHKNSIISIRATGRNGTYGYDLIEKAGTHALSGKGLALADAANRRLGTQKAGRLAYRATVGKLPELRKDMLVILNKWTETLNARLKR